MPKARKEDVYNQIFQLVEQYRGLIQYQIFLAHCVLLEVDDVSERKKLANELGDNITLKLQDALKIKGDAKKVFKNSLINGIIPKKDHKLFTDYFKKILRFLSKEKNQSLDKTFKELGNEIGFLYAKCKKKNIDSSPQFSRILSGSSKKNVGDASDSFTENITSSTTFQLPYLLKKSRFWLEIKDWIKEENVKQENSAKNTVNIFIEVCNSHLSKIISSLFIASICLLSLGIFGRIKDIIAKIFNLADTFELFIATSLLIVTSNVLLVVLTTSLITLAKRTQTVDANQQKETEKLQKTITLLLNDAFSLRVIEEIQQASECENIFSIMLDPNANFNDYQGSATESLSYFNLYKYLPSKLSKRSKKPTMIIEEEQTLTKKNATSPIEPEEISETDTHITRTITSSNNQKITMILDKNLLERIPDKPEEFERAFKEAHFGKKGTCFKPLGKEVGVISVELKVKGSKHRLWGTKQDISSEDADRTGVNKDVIEFKKFGKALH